MKKILTAVAAILCSFGTFAQDGSKASIIKKVIMGKPVTSLVINDGIRVVLMDDPGNELMIEGIPASVENVVISSCNGEITVSIDEDTRKPAVVYIPANFLKKIIINGSSIVSSYQTIFIARLDVRVAGECNLKIQMAGKINITTADDYRFVYTEKSVTY